MSKATIHLEEAIPFKDENWNIMQMIQYKAGVTVEQWENETVIDIEKQAKLILQRNIEALNEKEPIFIKQKNRLNFLLKELKEKLPMEEYRQVISKVKQI